MIFRLKNNDNEAFSELVDDYSHKVLNLCVSFTKNLEDAEDLTQDVFIKIYQSISSFKGNSSIATWIYKITVNQCYEFLRRNKRLKRTGKKVELSYALEYVTTEPSSNPEEILVNFEYRQILFSALEQLSEKQRVAFSLQHFQGFTYQEISDIMELSHAAVESLIFRARQNLTKELNTLYQNFYS